MTIAIYREEGGKFRVHALSDETVDGMRTVVMECIETLRPSPTCGGIKAGAKFDVACKDGCEAMVGWTLTEES